MPPAVSIGPDPLPFNVYSETGWCLGGPDTPSSTDPTTVDGCWAACLVDYPDSLVSADYWPKNNLRGWPKCWCQTACDSLSTRNVDSDNPVELALRTGPWQAVLPDHLRETGAPTSSGICCSSFDFMLCSNHPPSFCAPRQNRHVAPPSLLHCGRCLGHLCNLLAFRKERGRRRHLCALGQHC